MLQVLLDGVYRLVGVVYFLVMLIGVHTRGKLVGEVGWYVRRGVLAEEALNEFFDEIPAEVRHQAGLVVNLYENSFEVLVLAHGHRTKLHQEVSELESRSLRLDLNHLLRGVYRIDFQHEQVENEIGDERDLLLTVVQQRKHRRRVLRIVHDMDLSFVES